jgi:hypothetical protein
MKPISFKHQMKELQPSGKKYSDNVLSVEPLPVWTDGEQCVTCWEMSWRERISALFFGRVWLAVLSGDTQPPVFISAELQYLAENQTT